MESGPDQAGIQIPLAEVNEKLSRTIGQLHHEISMRDVLIEKLQEQLAEARAGRKE